MNVENADDYIKSSSYQKALKKLAVQLAQNIKTDVVYRNIPFGTSQLDIYSDGKNAILAVKSLSQADAAFKVREFQIPVSKLRKFLVSDEMKEMFGKGVSDIFLDHNTLVKQISQGISQLLHNSNKKVDETWIFPFYNYIISFTVTDVFYVQRADKDKVVGWMSTVQINGSQNHSSPEYIVEGLEDYQTRLHCLDYSIYKILNKISVNKIITAWDYSLMNENIAVIAA